MRLFTGLAAFAGLLAPNAQGDRLSQLPAPRGCLSERASSPCGSGKAVAGDALALSPDGRRLYTGGGMGLGVVARDPVTGALRSQGCVSWRPRCPLVAGIEGLRDLVVSPDGRHVYAAAGGFVEISGESDYPIPGGDAVTAFARLPRSPGLRPVSCLQSASRFRWDKHVKREPGCRAGRALAGAGSIAISPDGRSVYTAAWWTSGLAAFRRDSRSGGLTQLPGRQGCVRAWRAEGCAAAPIDDVRALVVSPDGRFVYVAGGDGSDVAGDWSHAGMVYVFARSARTGALRYRGKAPSGSDELFVLAIAPDGAHVYASDGHDVFPFRRDGATGALAVSAEDPRPDVAGVDDLAVGADGASVYAVVDAGVVQLARDRATGTLVLAASSPGCSLARRTRPFCMGTRESGTADAVAVDGPFVMLGLGDGVETLREG
jgi:DNA-binding beta-propeller fold protein YncE